MIFFIIISFLLILLSVGLFIKKSNNGSNRVCYSIIIACRNEEINLPALFKSLASLHYPKECHEIILVDDASTDETGKLIAEFCSHSPNRYHLSIPQKSDEYKGKKNALKVGIDAAKYDNLLFTDADCVVPENWLVSFNKYLSDNVGMIVGYSPEIKVSSFRRFTQILSANFYCTTIRLGFPFSNNGRNLFVNKKVYLEVGGFSSIKDYTCGEDKLLLNLIKRTRYKICYNAECKVITNAQTKDYINQQKRRYGQFTLSSSLYKFLSILVFLFYMYLPVQVVVYRDLIGPLMYFVTFLIFWVSGLIVHKERFHILDLLYIIIYPYYLIYYSILGMFSSWTWK